LPLQVINEPGFSEIAGRIIMKIYDISHTLQEGMPVWPGDWDFCRVVSTRIKDGEGSNSSNIKTALHCGTHMDAPSHTVDTGLTVDEIDLAAVIGPVLVISVDGPVIDLDDLKIVTEKKPGRVLFRCPGQNVLDCLHGQFAFPTPEAARFLVEAGLLLVGTNAPSVDPADSKTLETHRILMSSGIVVLENLCLEDVPDGEYQLIALPLKIAGADGSPVRAVLLEKK
jgi:arylformamidase